MGNQVKDKTKTNKNTKSLVNKIIQKIKKDTLAVRQKN